MIISQLKPFQIYYTVFFLFGLNSFISFKNIHKKRCKLITVSLRLIAISINAYIAYRECKDFEYSVYAHIFGYGVLIFVVCVNFTAIFESFVNQKSMCKILKELSSILKTLETYLNIKYPDQAVNVSLNRKIIIHFTIIVAGTVIKYYVEVANNLDPSISLFWTISNVIKYIHLLHVMFYIDFIKFTLASLSEKLSSKMNDPQIYWYHGQNNEFLQIMRHIKTVYFKLWNVSQLVNSLFGWFLVVLMFEATTTAIFNVYWSFAFVRFSMSNQIPRKYIFF